MHVIILFFGVVGGGGFGQKLWLAGDAANRFVVGIGFAVFANVSSLHWAAAVSRRWVYPCTPSGIQT
jgi:hypothetical protein